MNEQLFEGYPDPEPQPDPTEGMGSDAARTYRARQSIEAGIHPATKLALTGIPGETCGNCSNLWSKSSKGWSGWKCSEAARPPLDGPDMRKWWPGCLMWEAVR